MADEVPVPPLTYTQVEIRTPLINLADAKDRLKVRDDLHDLEVQRTVLEAQNQILSYLNVAADPAWTELTLPLHVRAAVLHALTFTYAIDRGDVPDPAQVTAFWKHIDALLVMTRDPVVW